MSGEFPHYHAQVQGKTERPSRIEYTGVIRIYGIMVLLKDLVTLRFAVLDDHCQFFEWPGLLGQRKSRSPS